MRCVNVNLKLTANAVILAGISINTWTLAKGPVAPLTSAHKQHKRNGMNMSATNQGKHGKENILPSQMRRAQCRGVTMLRQHFFMHDSLTSNSSGTSSVESSAGWILVLFFFLLNILGSPVGYAKRFPVVETFEDSGGLDERRGEYSPLLNSTIP